MRYLTQFFVLCLVSVACCCVKPDSSGTDTPSAQAPTEITLSPDSWEPTSDAGEYKLTVSAPARPKLEIPSEAKGWLSYSDGIFKDYKITFTMKVSANTEYTERSAQVGVSATGVSPVTFTVTQAAKEVI